MKTGGWNGIREKVEAGERLSYDDGVSLYRSSDLLALGYLANIVRERMHGDVTYFNVNRHINPTDVCVASCRLCAFGKQKRDPTSYTMSLEQVWETAGKGWSEAITEFHIVGGLHPELNLDWFCQMLRGLKERFPQIHLKAFTMVEIGYFARREKISVREVLIRLRDAGMDSHAGRRRRGLQRARAAHHLRSQADRATNGSRPRAPRMSWGCIPTARCSTGISRTKKIASIIWCGCAACRTRRGGFVTFIPLAFHPDNTALSHIPKTTGFDDLKNIAVARLMLDNIPHIKAYWIMMTPKVAQVALRFGSNDIDGTVVEEKIYHEAGATTSQSMRRGELLRLIKLAGRTPVERDTLYRPVQRTENAFTVLV